MCFLVAWLWLLLSVRYRRQSLPWITYTVSGISEREQAEILMPRLVALDPRFLSVVISNIGCRIAEVKLLKAQVELEACLASNPDRAEQQFPQVCQWEAEAGALCVRFPGASPIHECSPQSLQRGSLQKHAPSHQSAANVGGICHFCR